MTMDQLDYCIDGAEQIPELRGFSFPLDPNRDTRPAWTGTRDRKFYVLIDQEHEVAYFVQRDYKGVLIQESEFCHHGWERMYLDLFREWEQTSWDALQSGNYGKAFLIDAKIT